PLALIELPVAAKSVALDGGSLPLTARLEQAFAARLSDLGATERALLLVAALEDGEPAELLRAAEKVRGAPVDIRSWDPVIAPGFGPPPPQGSPFRPPLIRSAVEQATPAEDRRGAHAGLADVLADAPARAVWHRAAATTGYDEVVAAALAEAAERA